MDIKTTVAGPVQTNCYILTDGNACVIIDPGDNGKRILDNVTARVEGILITHGHFDHIGALAYLKEKTGAPVYIHKNDAEMLISDRKSLSFLVGVNTIPTPADRLLEDNDTIPFNGKDIKVILTNGHTRGSVCYIYGNTIFSGDTLFCEDMGRTDLPGGSYDELCSSLKRLFALPGDYRVLPGHEEETTLSHERAYFSGRI